MRYARFTLVRWRDLVVMETLSCHEMCLAAMRSSPQSLLSQTGHGWVVCRQALYWYMKCPLLQIGYPFPQRRVASGLLSGRQSWYPLSYLIHWAFPVCIRRGVRKYQLATFLRGKLSYRQLRITPPQTRTIDQEADVRSHDGYISCEARYRAEEVAKQDHDAI